jgi:hypothetical protein
MRNVFAPIIIIIIIIILLLLLLLGWGETETPRTTAAKRGPLYQPRITKNWWNDCWQGKKHNIWTSTCRGVILSGINPIWNATGLHPGLGGEKPATTVGLNFHGSLDACHGSYPKHENTVADLLLLPQSQHRGNADG